MKTKPVAAQPAPAVAPAPAPPEGRESRFFRLIDRLKACGVSANQAADVALSFVTPPGWHTSIRGDSV